MVELKMMMGRRWADGAEKTVLLMFTAAECATFQMSADTRVEAGPSNSVEIH